MKKINKKAFTLIELLAVIIILAVIALIATPIVLDVVESAKKSSFESSAYGMIDAMKLKSMESMIEGNSMAKEYDFSVDKLDIQGDQLNGTGKVDNKGRIAIAVNNGKWCATKAYSEGTITIKEYVESECTLPVEETAAYDVEDYVKIKVGPNAEDVYNFYILSVDGENVTAIMDRNLGDDIAWVTSADMNTYATNNSIDTSTLTTTEQQYAFMMKMGPITAKTQLPTTWSNATEVRLPNVKELIAHTEWYKGLTDTENWENEYVAYAQTAMQHESFVTAFQTCGEESNKCYRAAFTAYEEATGLDSILLPAWLDINLYTSGDSTADSNGNYKYGYWTQDIFSAGPDGAWFVYDFGFVYDYGVAYSGFAGVRPVITINQSNILEKLSSPIYVDEGFSRE